LAKAMSISALFLNWSEFETRYRRKAYDSWHWYTELCLIDMPSKGRDYSIIVMLVGVVVGVSGCSICFVIWRQSNRTG